LQLRGLSGEVVGVFPSDHLISDEGVFQRAVGLAEQVAKAGYLTTLGVQPRGPATGYGYIEVGDEGLGARDNLKALKVKGFREKPNEKTAREYIESGRYFWNAGMFVFKVAQMIQYFREFQPDLWSKISTIDGALSNAHYNYAMVENISLDYAIMEKLKTQACVPCDMGWSDVGSWDEVARIGDESTAIHSRSEALIYNQNSANNYVFTSQKKVVGLIDVTDTLVIDTPDALLLVRRGSSQKVKELVDAMKESGQPEATSHLFETRPWGGFEILADEEHYKTKKITIDVGGQLSYQTHKHRQEHWVVISGEGEVTLNDQKISLKPGQSIHIPTGAKHRIRNPGGEPLIFIEVQTGTYFGEDDIVRYLDDYNRVPT
jgi:mannose-1-phosphate guanylyltransferase/mannose-6-phosphate isomerase